MICSTNLFSQNNNHSIGFIENKGQIVDQKGKANDAVKYLLNTNGLNVQIRNNGFSYDVYETKKHKLSKKEIAKQNPFPDPIKDKNNFNDYKIEYIYHRIDIDFINSNKNVSIIPAEKSFDYDNYYNVIGIPEGVLNVYKYQQITYKNIYPNIDVVFSIPKDSLKPVEYNFVVRPNGKISDIQLQFNGVKTELVDNKINMKVRFGAMEETLPKSWIEENGKADTEIAIGYKKISKNVYGFESDVAVINKTLIIDPVPIRLWGTYYGGEGGDFISKTTNDLNGDLYAGGASWSFNNIATSGAIQEFLWTWSSPNIINSDCFIVKFNSNGVRLWGTYIGGNEQDDFKDLIVDNQNNLIITGDTNSNLSNFTTLNSHQSTLFYNFLGSANNFDAFLVKFNQSGQIIWGTFYGGNLNDTSNSVNIDSNNNIIIGGVTSSETNIATSGAHKTIFNNSSNSQYDSFIAKFNTNGIRLWGTYFGGNMQEEIRAIDIDSSNNIYFVGKAFSVNGISTNGSYQENKNNNWDGFIAKLSPIGTLVWGTYFGGENEDYLFNLKIFNDNLYVSGRTTSQQNIASPNSYLSNYQDQSNSGFDGFFAKFGINGNRIWSSYFLEEFTSIDIDNFENILAVGNTGISIGISTPNTYEEDHNYGYGFIEKFNSDGSRLWGTYYGGTGDTSINSIKYDKIFNFFYISGKTMSGNGISTPNSHQLNYSNSFQDGFLSKFKDCQSVITTSSNTPTCIGSNLNLTASGGTNYSWIGPNGFTSTQQNPTITNASALNSGQYSCFISGTGGCDGTNTINVIIGDTIKPIPNVNPLPIITGDCHTTITAPTATDNCAGTITAITTDPLSYSLPGTFTIHWNYDDGNGNIETQNQTIEITAVAQPTVTSPQIFCIQQNPTLNTIPITGQNIKWYNAQTSGNLLPNTTTLVNGTTYYASQTINSCESIRVPVVINIQNTLAPTGNSNQIFCSTQNATLSNINITGTVVNWYSSTTSTAILPSTTILVNGSTYYATQTVNGCESLNRLAVTISLINTLNASNYSDSLCDDLNDGSEIINFSSYTSNIIAIATGCTFEYYNSSIGAINQDVSDRILTINNYNLTVGQHIIYVRITSTNSCSQIVELQLSLYTKPIITINDIMPICYNQTITINAGTGFDSYLWSNGDITPSISVATAGSYSVTVTQNHGVLICSSIKNFSVVASNIPTINSIETSDWTDNENTITVLLTNNSIGNYEYSLDGLHYQISKVFTRLISGVYQVYVRDINGCGAVEEETYLLMYPKYFTPNGDGINDFWKINFSKYEPNLSVKIFDRNGKFIKSLNYLDSGWDGTYNSQQLPSDDYWFVVTRANGKEYKGHFAIKR